jgi:hypothetical protein
MSTAAETFKSIVILCIQGSMFAMVLQLIKPTLRNPRYRVLVRGLRLRHFGSAMFILLGTILSAGLLITFVPGMDIGWFTLLGGSGSVAVAAPAAPEHAPLMSLVLPLLLVITIALVMPIVVLREERKFRRGVEKQSRGRRWRRQIGFGLGHLVMGIPLGAALAITFAGGGFMHAYQHAYARRGSRLDALLAGAQTHLAYNAILLAIVFCSSAILLVGQ